jgi:hypothetical protein
MSTINTVSASRGGDGATFMPAIGIAVGRVSTMRVDHEALAVSYNRRRVQERPSSVAAFVYARDIRVEAHETEPLLAGDT